MNGDYAAVLMGIAAIGVYIGARIRIDNIRKSGRKLLETRFSAADRTERDEDI